MKNSLLFQDFFIYLSRYSTVFFKAYYYEKGTFSFSFSLIWGLLRVIVLLLLRQGGIRLRVIVFRE